MPVKQKMSVKRSYIRMKFLKFCICFWISIVLILPIVVFLFENREYRNINCIAFFVLPLFFILKNWLSLRFINLKIKGNFNIEKLYNTLKI